MDVQRETIIPHHYQVVAYKNGKYNYHLFKWLKYLYEDGKHNKSTIWLTQTQ